MSEYGLSGAQNQGYAAPSYAPPPASNVEWYSSGPQQYTTYAYDQSYASSSGAAYGTFEDEAPLLEGKLAICHIYVFGPSFYFPTNSLQKQCLISSVFHSAELGIDIPAILGRTKSILTFKLSGHDVDDLDLGGPLVYMAALAISHLLVRLSITNCF